MSKKRQLVKTVGWIAFGFILVVGIIAVIKSDSCQQCVQAHQHQAPHYYFYGFPSFLIDNVICFGAFINGHNAAITALATAIIAWFTITLSRVSGRQTKLISLGLLSDRPFLVTENCEFGFTVLANLDMTSKPPTIAKLAYTRKLEKKTELPPDEELPPTVVSAQFDLINHGKSPALIERVVGYMGLVDSVEELTAGDLRNCVYLPVQRNILRQGEPLAVHFAWAYALIADNRHNTGRFVLERIKAFMTEKQVLVFYGSVFYRDYLVGKLQQTDFMWSYNIVLQGASAILTDYDRYHQENADLSKPE